MGQGDFIGGEVVEVRNDAEEGVLDIQDEDAMEGMKAKQRCQY